MAAIEVDSLSVAYGARLAVDALSFSVASGEVVALLGPNGAGKTSTVETLEGYRSPSGGQVRVLGLDPVAEHRELVGAMGVMLQEGGVYPSMSPRRVLRLFAAYYEHPMDPEDLLVALGLTAAAGTPYKRLSGGERRRLSLALALVGRPDVVFLDEPTAGVDPEGRLAVREAISGLRAEGAAVLVTSHELDEVERVADRVLLIDDGRLVVSGPPAAVGGGNAIRFRVSTPFEAEALERALGVPVSSAGSEFRIDSEATPALIAGLTAFLADKGVALEDLRVGPERLEEVFLRLVARKRP